MILGTLNPALQDRNGQPKRDITTIIHILNDLLCAQYKNYSPGTASETSSTAKANATPGASSTTAASSSSKTRHSEPHKTENITKPTHSGSKPCSCSKDHSAEINTPILQKATSKSVNANNMIFPENSGEGNVYFNPQIHTRGNSVNSSHVSEGGTEILRDQINVTKGKMEQLKRIMEERKARRRERREARAAPYSTSWSLKSSDTMEMEEREETIVDRSGDNSTVKMQVDTASTSSSNNKSGGSTNSNGQNNPASQTGAGGNPSDIFNPELEPVTA